MFEYSMPAEVAERNDKLTILAAQHLTVTPAWIRIALLQEAGPVANVLAKWDSVHATRHRRVLERVGNLVEPIGVTSAAS